MSKSLQYQIETGEIPVRPLTLSKMPKILPKITSEKKEAKPLYKKEGIEVKGYLRELHLINLCMALLKVGRDHKEQLEGEARDSLSLAFEEGFEEMLDQHCTKLEDDLEAFFKQDIHRPLAEKLRKKLGYFSHRAIMLLKNHEVTPEVVVSYALYLNFCKRDKPLHENFKQFTDETRYSLIVDTLDASGYSLRKKLELVKLAKELVSMKEEL
jgi:hypothetical protein